MSNREDEQMLVDIIRRQRGLGISGGYIRGNGAAKRKAPVKKINSGLKAFNAFRKDYFASNPSGTKADMLNLWHSSSAKKIKPRTKMSEIRGIISQKRKVPLCQETYKKLQRKNANDLNALRTHYAKILKKIM